MTAEEWESASATERRDVLARAGARLRDVHYLCESVADCIPLIDAINTRVAAGERP
jgi:hypothetical protein